MRSIEKIRTLLRVLLGTVVIGSILGIENSQSYGCVYGLEMLSITNLMFLLLSGTLIYKAIRAKESNQVFLFLGIEGFIWITKLFLYKGGYVTGYLGSVNPTNALYDFASVGIRTWLLLSLLGSIRFRTPITIVVSIIILTVKINFFPMPWFSTTMWNLNKIKSEKQKSQIVGSYNGVIKRNSDGRSSEIELNIDSIQLTINGEVPFELNSIYQFDLESRNYGNLSTGNGISFAVDIELMNDDSLVMTLSDMLEGDYILELKPRDNRVR